MLRPPLNAEKPASFEQTTTGFETSRLPANDGFHDSKSDHSTQRQLDPRWHAQRAWNARNRHARHAHAMVAVAIKKGELIREPCAECGAEPTDFHHDPDRYEDVLSGEFLCRLHHRRRHAHLRKIGGS